MDIEIISQEPDYIRLKLIGESVTFGNILQEQLNEDKRVDGAGLLTPHPLKKEIIFQVYVNNGDSIQVFQENIEKLKNKMLDLKKQIEIISDK